MVFMQCMGIVFSLLLFIGSILGLLYSVFFVSDLSIKLESTDEHIIDIYDRLGRLESENIKRKT